MSILSANAAVLPPMSIKRPVASASSMFPPPERLMPIYSAVVGAVFPMLILSRLFAACDIMFTASMSTMFVAPVNVIAAGATRINSSPPPAVRVPVSCITPAAFVEVDITWTVVREPVVVRLIPAEMVGE